MIKRNEAYLIKVGNSIKNVRKLRHLSQREVAALIPMKEDALRKIERGYVSPLLITLKRIADALEVDIKVFL